MKDALLYISGLGGGFNEYIALLINYGWHSTSSLEHRLPRVEHTLFSAYSTRLALILIKYKAKKSIIIVIIIAFFVVPTIQGLTCLYWARLLRRRQSSFLPYLPKNDNKKQPNKKGERERERGRINIIPMATTRAPILFKALFL